MFVQIQLDVVYSPTSSSEINIVSAAVRHEKLHYRHWWLLCQFTRRLYYGNYISNTIKQIFTYERKCEVSIYLSYTFQLLSTSLSYFMVIYSTQISDEKIGK